MVHLCVLVPPMKFFRLEVPIVFVWLRLMRDSRKAWRDFERAPWATLFFDFSFFVSIDTTSYLHH
jgi:hypothetical protein